MPNTEIRAVRESMRLSQEEFAARVRQAGDQLGEPNNCTTRTVQRWEAGAISYPRRTYVRAVERATGYAAEQLGFDLVPRVGSLSDAMADHAYDAASAPAVTAPATLTGVMPTLTGIWESRCTYESSSRGTTHVDLANLIVIHAGDHITARSLEGSVTDGGSIMMQLEVRGRVVTGTWEQTTGAESYYRGLKFFGSIQMQVDASGGHMRGVWTGVGRDFDVNTGPWELIRRETSTGRTDKYVTVPVHEA